MPSVNNPNAIENVFNPVSAELYNIHKIEFLLNHFSNANLLNTTTESKNCPDMEFWSNEDFWDEVINKYKIAHKWVKLSKFQIIDWFPRTPGLYFLPSAVHARNEARQYIEKRGGVSYYRPEGKSHMIQGGIGAVRFKTIKIENEECWLCTATSDNQCHTGVPVAIPNYIMSKINYKTYYQLVGKLKFLPKFLEGHFSHYIKIPQIYLMIDQIEPYSMMTVNIPKITPMVYFQRGNSDAVSFVYCRPDSYNELEVAAGWLNNYVGHYGGTIMTNYDEQMPFFKNAKFSLHNVMTGNIEKTDFMALDEYKIEDLYENIKKIVKEHSTMTSINVTLGDGTVIHGDVIVTQKIEDSFNKVNMSDVTNDLKQLLKQLASQTGVMSEKLTKENAEQVANDLESLTNELTSKKPRRKWWQLSLQGLKEAAEKVGDIGKPIIEIVAKIIPLVEKISV